jgi:hypothetical protein
VFSLVAGKKGIAKAKIKDASSSKRVKSKSHFLILELFLVCI